MARLFAVNVPGGTGFYSIYHERGFTAIRSRLAATESGMMKGKSTLKTGPQDNKLGRRRPAAKQETKHQAQCPSRSRDADCTSRLAAYCCS
jgi:hypothetical protein